MSHARASPIICTPGIFRLFLATCVLVSHATNLEVGRISVLIFFVLSGYWVHDIWTARFADKNVCIFYISRYFRIAPVYFFGLTLALILSDPRQGYMNYFIINASNSGEDPLWVSWSLDIELQFYIILPLMELAVTRSTNTFLAATFTASMIGWLIYYETGFVEILQYLPAFAGGMLIRKNTWDPGRDGALLSLAAFAGLTLAFALCRDTAPYLLKDRAHAVDRDVFAFLWMIPLLPYVAHSLARPSGHLDRHMGNLSFSLYIIHPVIMTVFASMVPHKSLPLKLASLVSIFAAASAVYVFVDRPFDGLRRRVERRLRSRCGSTPPGVPTVPGRDETGTAAGPASARLRGRGA